MDAGHDDLVFRGLPEKLRRSDPDAWRQFVEWAEPRLLRALMRIHHLDLGKAQDVTRSSLSRAWEARKGVPDSSPQAFAWVLKIAKNALITEFRKQERQVPLDAEVPEPLLVDPPERAAVEEDDTKAFRKRAHRHASAQVVEDLFSSVLNGKNYAEIGKDTGRSEQVVAKGLQRLRDSMRADPQSNAGGQNTNWPSADGGSQ